MRQKNESLIVLFGSCARKDDNRYSDCDLLLLNTHKEDLKYSSSRPLNLVEYDQDTFEKLYRRGSLFLYHVFHEGILLDGERVFWDRLRCEFKVQENYEKELKEIFEFSKILEDWKIFGGTYLAPLTHAFTSVKNACIFSLAHKGIFQFEKSRCFLDAIKDKDRAKELFQLKKFYDYSERGVDNVLPFQTDDIVRSVSILKLAVEEIERMYNVSF